MKKTIRIITLSFLLVLCACQPAAEVVQPDEAELREGIPVTDALDQISYFLEPPQKIALAGKANMMIADALYLFPEASDRVGVLGVGSQNASAFIEMIDPKYAEKPKFDNEVGPEQIAAEKPDVVVLKSYLAKSLGATMEELGIPAVYLDFETPEQYFRDLKTLGELFQNEERANELIAYYQGQADKIQEKVGSLSDEEKPDVLLLYYSSNDGEAAFNIPPASWMQTLLVDMSGGNAIWKEDNIGSGWKKVSMEQIAVWDPDKVFIVSYFSPIDEVMEDLKADPQWQVMRAAQEGELYGFPGDIVSWDQPDTRWVLGLNWVVQKTHPDLFPDLDIKQEAQTFYEKLYGLDEAAFKSNILPLLSGDIE